MNTSKGEHTPYSSAVLAVILSLLHIVPSDRIARISEALQWRHVGDIQRLRFRLEVGLNDVALRKDWLWRVMEWIRRTTQSWPCAGPSRGFKQSSVYICVSFFVLVQWWETELESAGIRKVRECQESPLKLDKAEDNSAHTVFLTLSHTPVVTICASWCL